MQKKQRQTTLTSNFVLHYQIIYYMKCATSILGGQPMTRDKAIAEGWTEEEWNEYQQYLVDNGNNYD